MPEAVSTPLENSLTKVPLPLSTPEREAMILQITDLIGIGLVRDAEAYAKYKAIPRPGTTKRLNWEKARELMVSSFRKLYGLDQVATGQRDAWGTSKRVIDLPTNPQLPPATGA